MKKQLTELAYATSLRDLCTRMNQRCEEERQAKAAGLEFEPADLRKVPNFGGPVPRDTSDVWSWNSTHWIVPVAKGVRAFKVVERLDVRLEQASVLRARTMG